MTNRSKATNRLHLTHAGSEWPRPGSGPAAGLPADLDSQIALRAAQSHCTILVTGETGVGKGQLAKWLHDQSPRREGPFIPVNCGAIPDSLIDSQLFGHVRGSFSGATADHLGLIRAAENGTLLLDEISELPSSAQSRLLRLLQDREVQPIGHSRPVIVDVRVVAATNIDLAKATREGRFREDLLFRLDVIRLYVRALRERTVEIPGLIDRFNHEFAGLYRQSPLTFDREALNALRTYHWPGNIRQLRTLVERLHVLCPGEPVTVDLLQEIGQLAVHSDTGSGISIDRLKLDELRRVLAETGGSIARAAIIFGVHRSTIYRWLRDQEA
jgi:DNA-binding NtrC family response regulator